MFAREHNLLVSIRGGGHGVTGNAVCNDGLVIDLSRMRFGSVRLRWLRLGYMKFDPFQPRILSRRQRSLPDPMAMSLLRPPPTRRDRDTVPGAYFSKPPTREADTSGNVDDGFRPDLLIERVTREDNWFVRHTPILAICPRTGIRLSREL
jgi:hypothetical protein